MDADRRVTDAVQLRRVPVALTEGWGGVGAPAVLHALAPPRTRLCLRADDRASSSSHQEYLEAPEGVAEDSYAPGREIGMAALPFEHHMLEPAGADTSPGSLNALFALLEWQGADGSFGSGSEVLEELEPDELAESLQEIARRWGQQVADTLAALSLLEEHFSEWSAEWHAAAAKARRWLERQGAPASLDEAQDELNRNNPVEKPMRADRRAQASKEDEGPASPSSDHPRQPSGTSSNNRLGRPLSPSEAEELRSLGYEVEDWSEEN
jgi:hypothetical protein